MSSFSKQSEGELAAGQMLGRYELLSPIGRGGMGNVWAARLKGARGFRKLFAVKTISNVVDDPRLEQMLFEEATLASQIQHPNVVETIELGEHEGKLYLVMDLVDGESLSFILRKAQPEGGVPLPVGVNLLGQVLHGLQAAHDLTDERGEPVGLVHRDISPPNVLVTYSGTVKIVDFGVAITAATRASDPAEVKGKVSYFAPEQLRAQLLDARVDVFAAGILLYLLTTGRHPFRASAEADTINRILSAAQVTPPSVFLEDYPEALESVLLRALEKERDRRYASAGAFLEALERAVPSAFGPAGDKLAADYVQGLLRERMLERRHVLRTAEDYAESSSPHASIAPLSRAAESSSLPASGSFAPLASESTAPRALESRPSRTSVLSVPAVVTTRFSPARASRSGTMALGAVVLTLIGSALTVQGYSSSLGGAPARVAAAGPARAEANPPPQHAAGSLRTVAAPLPAPVSAPAAPGGEPSRAVPVQSRARLPQPAPRESRVAAPVLPATSDVDDQEPERQGRAPLAVSSGLGALAEPLTAPVAGGLEVPPPALTAARTVTLTPSPVVAPSPPSQKNTGPAKSRQIASKLGHGRLTVDPLSESHRVRLPQSLQRTGQTFTAALSICVGSNGSVTGVKFLRSAGPMIDRQVAQAVSRWRYRPLLEGAEAVPFCYALRYEFAGR